MSVSKNAKHTPKRFEIKSGPIEKIGRKHQIYAIEDIDEQHG
jgi:hypothetical protein